MQRRKDSFRGNYSWNGLNSYILLLSLYNKQIKQWHLQLGYRWKCHRRQQHLNLLHLQLAARLLPQRVQLLLQMTQCKSLFRWKTQMGRAMLHQYPPSFSSHHLVLSVLIDITVTICWIYECIVVSILAESNSLFLVMQGIKSGAPVSSVVLQPPIPGSSSSAAPAFSYNISQTGFAFPSGQHLQSSMVKFRFSSMKILLHSWGWVRWHRK